MSGLPIALPLQPLDRRGRRLFVALAFLRLPIPSAHQPSGVAALHDWLDTWVGIGAIEAGMNHQGFDLALTRYANEGWRATFFNTGKEHAVVAGSAWEPTAWRAVQGAAWDVLWKQSSDARSEGAMTTAWP